MYSVKLRLPAFTRELRNDKDTDFFVDSSALSPRPVWSECPAIVRLHKVSYFVVMTTSVCVCVCVCAVDVGRA